MLRRAITPPKNSPIGQSAGVSPCAAATTHARMSDTKPAPATATTAASDDVFSDDVSDEALLAACQKAGEPWLAVTTHRLLKSCVVITSKG